MSCIVWPRTAKGLCSPSAHRTPSVMFDLPHPLGPTITLTPGENRSLVRSGKDLKPLIVIELRCTAGSWVARDAVKGSLFGRTGSLRHGLQFGESGLLPTAALGPGVLQGLLRGSLLSRLLRAPLAAPNHLALDQGGDLEAAGVRGSHLAGHLIPYVGALPGQALLESGLEVQELLGRDRELVGEGRHRCLRGLLEAVMEVAGAQHGLAHGREGTLAPDKRIRIDATFEVAGSH